MKISILSCGLVLFASLTCQAALVPLATFGGGDGWLAPGEGGITWLTTDNTQRGLAYNPTSGNLILPSRTNGNIVKVVNGVTGAGLSDLNNGGGFTGGTFPINAAGVADDGAIYVGNLSTSLTGNFKVYRWATEGAAPTVAFDGLTNVTRTGDAFAATGSGTGTVLAAAGSNNVSASNFAALSTTDGSTFSSTAYLSVPGTTTTSNDYRLSLAFVDSDTLIGNQGSNARLTDFASGTATVTASIPTGGVAARGLDYTVIGGTPILAVIDTGSSLVQILDITNPSVPVLLDTGNNTTGALVANANGASAVAWGAVSGNSATLYAMSTNQGIQAFTFTLIPEPSSFVLMLLAIAGCVRKLRK